MDSKWNIKSREGEETLVYRQCKTEGEILEYNEVQNYENRQKYLIDLIKHY